MKNDQYLNYEVNLLNDDKVACMMKEFGGALSFGVYMVMLQYLRAQDTYEASCRPVTLGVIADRCYVEVDVVEKVLRNFGLFIVDEVAHTFRSPYLDRVMKKLDERRRTSAENGKKGGRPRKNEESSETPASKAEKPNEKQKSIEEQSRRITTIEYNSSNTTETAVSESAAVAVGLHSAEEEGQRPLQAVQFWETLVDQLAASRSYMEQAGMHSGMGALFLNHQKRILQLFKVHIRLYSKERELLFLEDVRRYFSNYVAAGSTTCLMLRKTLLAEINQSAAENMNRFETLVGGQRMYLGHPIPADAPPRPDAISVWNDEQKKWTR